MTISVLKPFALAVAVGLLATSSVQAGHGCGRTTTYSYPTVVHRAPVVVHTPPVVQEVIVEKPVVVQPLILKRKLVSVEQGSSLRVKVNFLGTQQGFVFMKAGKLTLQCPILEWTPSHVVFQLPEIGVLSPTEVLLQIAKPDGKVARSTNVLLTPTPDIEVFRPGVVQPRAPRSLSSQQPELNTGGIQLVTGN